ncbi:MAG: hypothetical protein AAF960_04495 [Bacteroidota bacterium]
MMTPTIVKLRAYFLLLLFAISLPASGQQKDVCANQDCPPAIMEIPLTTADDANRTVQFILAYQQLKQTITTLQQDAEWKQAYDKWDLVGRHCVRMYHLEGLMAYEYTNNPDFKTFIDQQEADKNDFLESGFRACRKALNLEARLRSNCNRELKKLAASNGPRLEDLPSAFQKLGQVLGYFDETGKLLKTLVGPPVADEAQEVAIAKEAALQNLKAQLASLTETDNWNAGIKLCEDQLNGLAQRMEPLKKKQSKFKSFLKKVVGVPKKLLGKLAEIKILNIKLTDLLPVGGRLISALNQLLNTGNTLTGIVEKIAGKQLKLQETIEGYDKKLGGIQNDYNAKVTELKQLKSELTELIIEKANLDDQLGKPVEKITTVEATVNDFIAKYAKFGAKEKCVSTKDLQEKIASLEQGQTATEKEVIALEAEIETTTAAVNQLNTDTRAVEATIETDKNKAATLKAEQEAIKEEFGKALNLQPVPLEEWVESFEVKRPYWEAVFHPDDEVVEGFVGKYFQVQLKDADKNVKVLFQPGAYFMDKSNFRDSYGSTIGAFVVETLHAMKKNEAEQVKVFVQGSADIAGHKTFKGQLDERYPYERLEVLPKNKGKDSFANQAQTKSVASKYFTNDDLPDLRGHFLKEMITIYSKKLKPILLEGSVKTVREEGERNAVIYLFIPEKLLD